MDQQNRINVRTIEAYEEYIDESRESFQKVLQEGDDISLDSVIHMMDEQSMRL